MESTRKRFIWLCLCISLFLIPGGIFLRMSNDIHNRSVVTAADYYDFLEAAKSLNIDSDIIMKDLMERGCNTIAVKESENASAKGSSAYFDESVLSHAKENGFNILLRPKYHNGDDSDYFNDLNRIIHNYQVRSVIFDGNRLPGSPDKLDQLEQLITSNSIIVGIIEPKTQIGYQEQEGLRKLIPAIKYSINRVYITPQEDLKVLDGESLLHRWLRGIVDRSIRFVYVSPLKNSSKSSTENLSDTLNAVGQMNSILITRGYGVQTPIQKLNPASPGKLHYWLISLNIFLAFTLFLLYNLDLNRKAFFIALNLAGLLLISINLLAIYFSINLPMLLAAAASVIYPSLAGSVLLYSDAAGIKKHLFHSTVQSLAIFTGISLAGGYVISTAMSDISYTMNLKNFNAVYATLLAPLLLFFISYIFYCIRIKKFDLISSWLKSYKRINFRSLITLFIIIIILYIYVSRSGNDSLIPASALELKLRNRLEDIFLVRPRFKEFLIGYPCLFAFVYLETYSTNIINLLNTGLGMVIGSISIVNSFCHVFTGVGVSIQRTINGLVLGLITGSLTLLFLTARKDKRI